jgi:uncharacterized protein YycO
VEAPVSPSETVFKRDESAVSPWPSAGLYFVVQTHGFVPWVIRRATRSPYDHAGIIVDNAGTIIEAEPDGVRLGHLWEYKGCRIAINSGEDMTVAQRTTVAATAKAMIGKPYGDLQIVDDGLECFGWHWKWLLKWASGDGEVVCSQLVALAGQAAGLDWRGGAGSATETTPAMLARRPVMQPWAYPAAA